MLNTTLTSSNQYQVQSVINNERDPLLIGLVFLYLKRTKKKKKILLMQRTYKSYTAPKQTNVFLFIWVAVHACGKTSSTCMMLHVRRVRRVSRASGRFTDT